MRHVKLREIVTHQGTVAEERDSEYCSGEGARSE